MRALDFILGRRQAEREAASQQDLDALKAQVAGLTEERKEDKVLLKQMQNTWEVYAAQISDLQRENAEKGRLLIQQGTQLDNEIRERGKLVDSLTERAREIGSLEGQIARMNKDFEGQIEKIHQDHKTSQAAQGERLGEVEKEVSYLTKERATAADIALRAEAQVYFLRSELVKRGANIEEINAELGRIAADFPADPGGS